MSPSNLHSVLHPHPGAVLSLYDPFNTLHDGAAVMTYLGPESTRELLKDTMASLDLLRVTACVYMLLETVWSE